MSAHAYTRCWLHLIWGTRNREKLLHTPESRIRVSKFLHEYAQEKEIYMKINYVNPEHVHALIDLPASLAIKDAAQLLKGSSSSWINKNDIIAGKFSWGRGYGAFSVSHSGVDVVAKYITNQEEHHRKKSFQQEYDAFVRAYGLAMQRSDRSR